MDHKPGCGIWGLILVLFTGVALLAAGAQADRTRGGGPPDDKGGRPGAMDTDRDGIPDTRDLCPQSPRHAISITDGCSAVEIVGNPELVGTSVDTAISMALEGLDARTPRGGTNIWKRSRHRSTGSHSRASEDESGAA